MAEETVLIVEDDEEICELISMYLEKERFRIHIAGDGYSALELVHQVQPDLILLDVILPGLDGFELCSEVRKITACSILFVSSKDEEIDKILGLGIGGDDYITKPFSPSELTARVKSHLRRNRILKQTVSAQKHVHEDMFSYNGLAINFSSCLVTVNNEPVNLSTKEFQILSLNHIACIDPA